MDTHELQNRLEYLLGERIPRSTLWHWVKNEHIPGPKRRSFGKGGGSGRYGDWSEEAFREIATLLAIRKIRRAKAFLCVTEPPFSSCALLKAVSLAYTDMLPVRRGVAEHVWNGIMEGAEADMRTADIDSLGCKQIFFLPSPFIPLPGEPRVSPDDEVHAATVAAVVIAFEKEKQGWGRKPARVVFPWYLEFPLLMGSQYAGKDDWDPEDYDHLLDYDMMCVRDGVLLENADSDELIICLDSRIVLKVCRGAVQACLPWFMARRGYRSDQSGRRYPGLPLYPPYLRSKPTRPNEPASFRIRRRGLRMVSNWASTRDGIRKRAKKKSGYLRPWKRRRAKGAIGRSAPVVSIDIRLIKPRSFPD